MATHRPLYYIRTVSRTYSLQMTVDIIVFHSRVSIVTDDSTVMPGGRPITSGVTVRCSMSVSVMTMRP